jgi:hypothetical protein
MLEAPPKNTPFDVIVNKIAEPNPVFQRWINKLQSFVNAPVSLVPPPTSASPGNAGQISTDGNFLYICVAAGSWKRVALSSF